MRIIQIIKKKGIIKVLLAVLKRIFFPINKVIFMCMKVFPVNKKIIVFESEGDFSDNSFALYEYIAQSERGNQYKYVWLVDDVKKCRRYKNKNTIIVKKRPARISLAEDFYLAICGFYIYDHTNILGMYGKRKTQHIVNLWHGCSFKKTTTNNKDKWLNSEDFMTITSDFWIIMSKFVGCEEKKCISLGYPRNDYLFKNTSRINKWKKRYRIDSYKKVFFWMPTFRQSNIVSISEDYYTGETGLPIFLTTKELQQLNGFLHKYNVLLLFKVHHLQLNYPAFQKKYTNILIITDEEINKNNLQLYQVIGVSDALITDYSAIFNDYLLLNRPMIFTLDDYEQYKESRGFSIENPIDYFPGFHVRNQDEFCRAVRDIINGYDPYIDFRNEMRSLMHKYVDGNSCKRVVNYIGIKTGGKK